MNVLLMVLQRKNTCCLRSHSLTQVLLSQHVAFRHRTLAFKFSLSLSAFAHSVSHSWRTNNPSPYHSQLSKKRTDFIHEKEKKDNTHRLTQYMQSEAVLFDGKAFTHGKKGTDTEIARTLQPTRGFFPGNWKRGDEL